MNLNTTPLPDSVLNDLRESLGWAASEAHVTFEMRPGEVHLSGPGGQHPYQIHQGQDGRVLLTSPGGRFAPIHSLEAWRALAAVVAMTPYREGERQDEDHLLAAAAEGGWQVVRHDWTFRWKYQRYMQLIRLEHPGGRVLYGSVEQDDGDADVLETVLLGGVDVSAALYLAERGGQSGRVKTWPVTAGTLDALAAWLLSGTQDEHFPGAVPADFLADEEGKQDLSTVTPHSGDDDLPF